MANNILGSILLNIATKADNSGLNKVDSSLKKINKTAKQTHKATGLLGNLSNKLFGGFNLSSVRDMFTNYLQFEKDLGAMKSRFYAITHDELKSEEEFQFIKNLAVETAQDIKSTADSYSIFYTAARKGLGKEGAREVFTNWTKVSRVLHLSAYQFERITYALREMTSKGKLYAQDLQMQIGTHVPDAVGIATEAIKSLDLQGVTTLEQFQKVAKNNIPLINKFISAFSKIAAERFANPEALKKAMQQPDALAQAIANYGFLFKEAFAKSGGSYMMIKILETTLNILKKIDFYSITSFLGKIANFTGRLFNLVSNNATEIKDILKKIFFILLTRQIGYSLGNYFSQGFGKLFLRSWGRFGLLRTIRALFSRFFIGTLSKSLVLFGTKMGLKGALAAFVNIIPIIGQIVSIGLAIWTIVDLIKMFLPRSKNMSDYLHSVTGLNASQVSNLMKAVNAKNPTSQQDVNRILGYYGEQGQRLMGVLKYNDNHTTTIYINGANKNAEEIALELKNELDKENKKKNKFFNNPNVRGYIQEF